MSIILLKPGGMHAGATRASERSRPAKAEAGRRGHGRGAINPYDGTLARADYRQIVRRLRAVEQQIGTVDILIKFSGAGLKGRIKGLVARSGATGKRYLLLRNKTEWLIAPPMELEREVRDLYRLAAVQQSALGLLGHQWCGE